MYHHIWEYEAPSSKYYGRGGFYSPFSYKLTVLCNLLWSSWTEYPNQNLKNCDMFLTSCTEPCLTNRSRSDRPQLWREIILVWQIFSQLITLSKRWNRLHEKNIRGASKQRALIFNQDDFNRRLDWFDFKIDKLNTNQILKITNYFRGMVHTK